MKIDPAEQKELLYAVETLRSFIENLEPQKSCISCRHWSGGGTTGDKWTGTCTLYNQAPPSDYMKSNDCKQWEIFDTIPY